MLAAQQPSFATVSSMLKPATLDEQLKQITSWFQGWSQFDQTSALCSLLNKATATQMKFLSLTLDHRLKNGYDTQELSRMESDANNPVVLCSLHNETEDAALQYLLSYILLLHPGNSKAREEYLKLFTKILFGSEEEEYLYQCQQLLSLALIHPAFPHEDREKLNYWFTKLETKRRKLLEKSVGDHSSSSPAGRNPYVNLQAFSSLPRNHSPQSSPLKRVYQTPADDSKSNTLNGSNRIDITFSQSSTGFVLNSGFERWDSTGEINTYPSDSDRDYVPKGFVGSSNNHHQTLPPQEHCHTPDSYIVRSHGKKKYVTLPLQRPSSVCSLPANLDDQSAVPFGFLKAGMKDVPGWLRYLRLHKYQNLFAEMSYEELLSTTDEFLESKDVTKGARDKIIRNIEMLHKRHEELAEIDQEVKKPGKLLDCIRKLFQALQTPIKPYQPPEESSSTGQPSDDKDGISHPDNAGDVSSTSSQEGSPRHERTQTQTSGDEGSSGESSSCSSPPSSPRMNRSSSLSSIDDVLGKDFPQEDLPSLFLKSLGKVFNQLMMHTETNEENLTEFIKALDLAICRHEGFRVSHKRMFFDWKQQCQQTLRVISPRKPSHSRGSYTIGGTPPHPNVPCEKSRNSRRVNGRGNTATHVPRVGYSNSLLGSPRSVSTLPRASPRQIPQPLPPPYYPPRSRSSSLNSVPIPVPPRARAHRYVNLPITSPSEVSEMYMDETHELCKSVTEHALEDQ